MKILNLETTKKQEQAFETFYKMLVETNKKFNLTAITQESEVAEKHFFDSAYAANLFAKNASVVDVGAGAGFPSVPLKIMRPDLSFTLIDSLSKRCNFLNNVKNTLKFTNFQVFHSRAEEFAKNYREVFNYAVARAVAPLPTLCELLAPLVEVGGKIIAYKGSEFADEIKNSLNAFKELSLKLCDTIEYILPSTNARRSIIIIEKTAETPEKYPRGQNKPRINPL